MKYKKIEPKSLQSQLQMTRLEREFPKACNAIQKYGSLSLADMG